MNISPETQEYIDTLNARIAEIERESREDCQRYEEECRQRVRSRVERCYAELQAPRMQLGAFFRVLAQAESCQTATMFVANQIQPLNEAGKARLRALWESLPEE